MKNPPKNSPRIQHEARLPGLPTPGVGTVDYIQDLSNAINSALAEINAGPIQNLAKLTPKGAVNTVFKATLHGEEVIVRVAKGSFGTFQKEAKCAQTALAEPASISTPVVKHIGKMSDFGARSLAYPDAFHISAFVKGKDLDDQALSLEKKTEAWEKVGETAARLHSKQVEGYGERLFDPPGTPVKRNDLLQTWVADIKTSLGLDSPPSRALAYILERHRDKISGALHFIASQDITPVLCHGNIQGSNVRVSENGTVSLLDWGSAAGHSALLDIAELYAFPPSRANPDEAETLRAAFFRGYGATSSPKANKLLSALIIARLAQGAAYMQDTFNALSEAEKISGRIDDISWT